MLRTVLMVAGVGTILMQDGPGCTIMRPYVGVAPWNVSGLAAALRFQCSMRWLIDRGCGRQLM